MISVRQVKAARALLGWSQADLAKASTVSAPTIARLEALDGTGTPMGGRPETVGKLIAALEREGIEFTNHGRPGVRVVGKKRPAGRRKSR
jgi:transcriptional regulator with XRE-family HTH domain